MSISTADAHPGRPRDEAREHAILDATLAVLGEVGYERMTMDSIAAEAKASKATIYRRWSNKGQLVVDALTRWAISPLEYPDLGSLRDELRLFVARTCELMTGPGGKIVIGLGVAIRTDPDLAYALDQCFADFLSSLDHVLKRAAARGELTGVPNPLVLFEVIPAVAMSHAMKGIDAVDEAYIDHLTDDIAIPLISRVPLSKIPPTSSKESQQ